MYCVCTQRYNLAGAGEANTYIVDGYHYWYRDTTELSFKNRHYTLHKQSKYKTSYLPDEEEEKRDSIANAISSPLFIRENNGVYDLVRPLHSLGFCFLF